VTGFLLATIIGIVGALLGGFLAKQLFGVQTLDTFFDRAPGSPRSSVP
jgi:uncharacterized membrane protein YeaQ/YmgE (transglycosylase-associated protein family)